MQDHDEIPDHGPDADGRDEDVRDDNMQPEEEDDGEDLLGDNMYKCDPLASIELAPACTCDTDGVCTAQTCNLALLTHSYVGMC